MFKSGTLTQYRRSHVFLWFALAFNAGAINTGGFLACRRFVSHVTGFATLAGIELAHWDLAHFLGMATVPLCFLGGVAVAGWLVDRRYEEGRGPHYALTMSLVGTALLFAAFGGVVGFFGVFGEEMTLKHDFLLLVLLCFASGLQNGAITTASGSTVRTTHLSGITTDLGLGVVRIVRRGLHNPQNATEIRACFVRAGTIFSFIFGSFLGAVLYLRIEYIGFLLPSIIAYFAAWYAVKGESYLLRRATH